MNTAEAPAEVPSVPAPTHDQLRSRRPRPTRARTISNKHTSQRSLAIGAALFPEEVPPLPGSRAECAGGPRPCPMVSCRWHLYLDVNEQTGSIKFNFPDIEVEDMGESCALDVADRGGVTLEHAGAVTNLTRERVRQVELQAMAKLHAVAPWLGEWKAQGEQGRRRLPLLEQEDQEEP